MAGKLKGWCRLYAEDMAEWAGMPDCERQAWVCLCWHYNRRSGRCFPSLETIAAEMGISKRSAFRGVHGLQKRGWVSVLKKRRNNGGGECNTFILYHAH